MVVYHFCAGWWNSNLLKTIWIQQYLQTSRFITISHGYWYNNSRFWETVRGLASTVHIAKAKGLTVIKSVSRRKQPFTEIFSCRPCSLTFNYSQGRVNQVLSSMSFHEPYRPASFLPWSLTSVSPNQSIKEHFQTQIKNTIFSFFRTGVYTSYICKKRGCIFLLTI